MNNRNASLLLGLALILLAAAGGLYAYQNNKSESQNPGGNGDSSATTTPDTATTTPTVHPTDTSSPFTIKVGQQVKAENFGLILNKITEDSRCPANVQCIWAGRVAAEFNAVSGTEHQLITLTTDSAVAFGGYDFKIESVKPAKNSSGVISPADYVLTVSYISNN
jgi:hypothetical protein